MLDGRHHLRAAEREVAPLDEAARGEQTRVAAAVGRGRVDRAVARDELGEGLSEGVAGLSDAADLEEERRRRRRACMSLSWHCHGKLLAVVKGRRPRMCIMSWQVARGCGGRHSLRDTSHRDDRQADLEDDARTRSMAVPHSSLVREAILTL